MLVLSRTCTDVEQRPEDKLLRMLGACTSACSCRAAILRAKAHQSWLRPSPLLGESAHLEEIIFRIICSLAE